MIGIEYYVKLIWAITWCLVYSKWMSKSLQDIFQPLRDRAFAADCGPRNSNRSWIEWVVRLKCGATAWTARPRLLSTHSRVASRAVYSTRFAALAVRGPRILWPTRLMFSQPMSFLVSPNLVLCGKVKNVYRHLLHFLTLMFSNKVETDQYIFYKLFLRHLCADYLSHSLHRYACH